MDEHKKNKCTHIAITTTEDGTEVRFYRDRIDENGEIDCYYRKHHLRSHLGAAAYALKKIAESPEYETEVYFTYFGLRLVVVNTPAGVHSL